MVPSKLKTDKYYRSTKYICNIMQMYQYFTNCISLFFYSFNLGLLIYTKYFLHLSFNAQLIYILLFFLWLFRKRVILEWCCRPIYIGKSKLNIENDKDFGYRKFLTCCFNLFFRLPKMNNNFFQNIMYIRSEFLSALYTLQKLYATNQTHVACLFILMVISLISPFLYYW